ncbi:DUF4249 family protein [Pedobacter rhodius]|uniref:DUF4249 family protein n=1 Tax=Pedobacter rhodius TaxID=3004098 RepID=A0ABT4KVH8_9SPHI|nr:DUF4249 family protein [Pedobacter sp. SJ11]MCZ4222930.1 DUF4249 family protein [Pedobacter sp. SJ11]
MKKTDYIFIIFALILLIGCKKETEEISTYNKPVVEAYLIPGMPLQVKVYYQKYLQDTITYGYPVTGLKPRVLDGSGNSVALTETNSGVYTYSDPSFVKASGNYTLNFDLDGYQISAETTMPDKPKNFRVSSSQQQIPTMGLGSSSGTFTPVIFSWLNPSSAYYMISFQNIEAYPTTINSRVTSPALNVEVLAGQTSSYQTQQANFNYLGLHRVLLFHINKEYNDALKASGETSLSLNTPYTNVKNGLGIFTAMQADTLYLSVYR